MIPLAGRIAAILPEAKILFVVRRQADMILASYDRYLRHAGGCASLDTYIAPPRLGRGALPGFDFHLFEYHRLVLLYRRLLGDEAVLVLPWELLSTDPSRFVDLVQDFADASPSGHQFDRSFPKDDSRTPTALDLYRLVNRMLLRSRFNSTPLVDAHMLALWLHRRADQLAQGLPSTLEEFRRRQWSLRVSEAIGHRFASSNRCLQGLSLIDLRPFGYDM